MTTDQTQNYYLPTTLDTKVNLHAREINYNLEDNIKRAVERKYGNRFFSFGHVRPGTIQVLKRSIGHKIGSSDFTGNMSFNVLFQCEVYLPQIGQEIDARVKSINKIGVLAKSDSNKLTILLSRSHQGDSLSMFGEIMLESRIRAKIMDFKIDSQNETIVIIGKIVKILSGVYQNYQLPRIDGLKVEIMGNLQPTSNIRNLYLDYGDFIDSVNSKSLMDPYAMFVPDQHDYKTWNQIRKKANWYGFKDYWRLVRSMVEDFELVHPSGGYNQNKGIAVLPLRARPISRAYFKFWELLHRYPEITNPVKEESQAVILCLGEAPGGFLQSLTHYRFKEHSRSSDLYYAYTLEESGTISLTWDNPISQKELFRLKDNQINLNYGDLTKIEDLMRIVKDLSNANQKADVITADAAFTHSKVYNYEEVVNYRIFFGEIMAALLNQKVGGSFVLKIFDILTRVTQQFLILLNHYYSEVFVTKPDFSRPASSEKFVVCLGFKGLTTNDQNEEQVTQTLSELLELWSDKISEKTDIFYPENENFLLSLLEYHDDDDFNRKLQEITHDHIKKQSEHINRGIHLIHTRTIFQQRKIEQLKQNQIRQAVNWCQRYKLEYNEDLALSNEELIDTGIVNTRRTLTYPLKTLIKDHQETYTYLKDYYQYANLEYIKKRSLSLNQQLEEIYQDYQSGEIYEFKISRLNPTPALNGELESAISDGRSNRWYVIYELLNQLPILPGSSSGNTFKAFINLDSITVDATRALVDFFSLNQKARKFKLDWTGHVIRQQADDPTGWFAEHQGRWLMNQLKDEVDRVRPKTLKLIQQHFTTANRQVDLYLSDFHLPLSNEAYGVLIPYPERYFLRDYLSQILAGLFSLKNGGNLLMRQYTFFEELTVSLIALLEDLFGEVTIVKPLIGQTESVEVYLFAQGFQSKKFTSKMQTDLLSYLSDELPESREELVEQEDLLLSQLPESCQVTPNEIESLKSKLIYVGYRIYVLNQFPRLQINLDLYHNTRYQLNSQQEATVRHLLGEKQEIVNKPSLGLEDQAELVKLNQQLEEQFSEVTERIVMEDFRYLLEQTVTNWLEQNPIN